jgi:NAD-dependent DNA ligase
VDFVAYELIEMPNIPLGTNVWENQLCFLKKYFKVVFNRVLNKKYIDQDVLLDYLERRRQRSEYQIDGLVVMANSVYIRNDSGNPKYAFAFKSKSNNVAETVVDRVEWNLSKGGKYKPRIFVAPTQLAGVTISCLTGFNARYIVDNSIGEGSRLLITRSGDVIPHIVAVLSSGLCELPSYSEWRSVDLCHTFEENPKEVEVKKMVYFLSSIKVKNCKERTISKLYDHGIRSIEDLLNSDNLKLQDADGIGPKLAQHLYQETRDRVAEASVHELLAALNAFGEGIGLKKIEVLKFADNGDLYSEHVKGISVNTVREKILPYLDKGLKRVRNLKRLGGTSGALVTTEAPISERHSLSGQVFVFTGFRDKGLEKKIRMCGGDVRSAISGKTTALVVEDGGSLKVGAKWTKAIKLGIPGVTKRELIKLVE